MNHSPIFDPPSLGCPGDSLRIPRRNGASPGARNADPPLHPEKGAVAPGRPPRSRRIVGRFRPGIPPQAVLAVLLSVLLIPACARNRIRTEEIPVENLRCKECAPIVQQTLLALNPKAPKSDPVVIQVVADVSRRRVVVTYNDALTQRLNLVRALSRAGFDADGIPGDPGARERLPECCR